MSAWRSRSGSGRSPAATARPSGVAGSTVSAYALMCSGASATASRERRLPRLEASRPRRRRSGPGSRSRSRRGGRRRTPRGPTPADGSARATASTDRVERLRAHREPAVAGLEQRRQLGSSTVSGFASVVISASSATSNVARRCAQERREVGGRLHRGRAAAQEHALDRERRPTTGAASAASATTRPQVARCEMVEPGVRVEVAVAAAGQAERDMDVDPGTLGLGATGLDRAVGHFFFSLAAPSSTRSAAMNASCGTSTRADAAHARLALLLLSPGACACARCRRRSTWP